MFKGIYNVICDGGRVWLPDKFRIKSDFILFTNEFVEDEKCRYLCLYPLEAFEDLFGDVIAETRNKIDPQACMPDTIDRIYLPLELREYSEIGKEVTLVGVGEGIEIWDRKKWEKYEKTELRKTSIQV